MEKKIETYLETLKQEVEVRTLLNVLCEIGTPYVIGGAVRDILTGKQPKDVDIMLESNILDLTSYVEHIPHIKNRFGGFKLLFHSIEIDLWLMQDHYPFKQHWYTPSIENFIYTPIFNIDAIYYNMKNNTLFIEPLMKSFQNQELDFQLQEPYISLLPYMDMNVAKAFVLKQKYNLQFSPTLYLYIKEWLEHTPNSYQLVAEKQVRNYGKVIIELNDIKKTFN